MKRDVVTSMVFYHFDHFFIVRLLSISFHFFQKLHALKISGLRVELKNT